MSVGESLIYRSERWMYSNGHPNRLAKMLNRCCALVGAARLWPNRLVTLEVRGRRSGRLISFPLIVADYQGERYLVSMLGEDANWVANVRAAGGHAFLHHGEREAVRLEEVDPTDRGPILRRHLEVAPAARSFTRIDRRAPVTAFDPIAANYPVFRICSEQSRALPDGSRWLQSRVQHLSGAPLDDLDRAAGGHGSAMSEPHACWIRSRAGLA